VLDNSTSFPLSSTTYATLLQQAGYTTGFTGKWHMGNQSGKRPGFDFSAGFVGQGEYFDKRLRGERQAGATTAGPTDVTTDYAIDFLKAQQGNPFSLTVAFKSSHTAVGSAAEVRGRAFGRHRRAGGERQRAAAVSAGRRT
jgi:arylsulfatase A-like enzyme